jgi:hypothetical protein
MKILLLLFLSMLSLVSVSQIKFSSYIESGYEDRNITILKDPWPTSFELHNMMYGILSIGANYKGLSLYTNTKTYMKPESFVSYNPLLVEYRLGVSYKYKKLSLGYEHLCAHQIEGSQYHEAYDKLSIRLDIF